MRILITGATGFVGSHLVKKLAEQRDHDLYTLQRYVTGRYVLGAEYGTRTMFCDVRDHFAVSAAVREIQPEIVIHLAAVSPVSYSYGHPNEVVETNFIGTINLAESCLRESKHFKHFLFASTSETYGSGPVPKREETPQSPNSPYSVSKFAAEKYISYMWDAYKFPMTVLRAFNTYGRCDNTHFLVERILVQMLRGETVKLGDPTPERDLLYVDDHVDAYLTCMGNPKAIGERFNFATGKKITVKALVEKMKEITGFRGEVLWDTIPRRPLDVQLLYGDASKARSVLGWQAKVSLEEGLCRTVDFWRRKIPSVEIARVPETAKT